MSQALQTQEQVRHTGLFGGFDFCDTERTHFQHANFFVYGVGDVIEMIVRGWSSNMRHVSRTHRVDLD